MPTSYDNKNYIRIQNFGSPEEDATLNIFGATNSIEIRGIWRPGQHLELFIMFLKPFLNNAYCTVWCSALSF